MTEKYKHIIYSDTDSVYCTITYYMDKHDIPKTKENAVAIADTMENALKEQLPPKIMKALLIPKERAEILKAGREVVARKGLFKDVKKRYALHVLDVEGKIPKKPLKIMGMETRRSDTPKFIQSFLEKCIELVVVEDHDYNDLKKFVEDFRENVFRTMNPWERGSPGRVSKLTIGTRKRDMYQEAMEEGIVGVKKPVLHYSVTAASNTNQLIESNQETRWDKIRDGDKIEVLYLLPNLYNIDNIAIKVEENYIPTWFKELPFDNDKHEKKLIDKKLENIFGVLKWRFEADNSFVADVSIEVDFLSDLRG